MIQIEKHSADSSQNDASIRQIALLLHTLPQRTHRVLLGQLGDDHKQSIAKELLALGEVDALEQYRVLKRMHDELQFETTSARKVESEIQDEIQIGRARVSKKPSKPIHRADETTSETTSETGGTHTDSVPPNTTKQQNDPRKLEDRFQTQTDVVTGQAAMPPTPEVLQSMFAQFHQTQAAGVLPAAAMQSDPNVLPINGTIGSTAPSLRGPETADCEVDASELAERVDRFLVELSPQTLCRALGMATTKQAFLVLCGLPNETAETILDLLPRRQSRKVRSDMRRMGQLQLSDIDDAKQTVTEIAMRLTTPMKSFAA